MFLTIDYSKGIGHLKKLDYTLSEYDTYFVIMNTCKFIETKLEGNLSKEEIEVYSKEILSLLSKLRYSGTIRYQDEQRVVEKAFDIAYKFIKLELINFGESKIYEASKDQEIDCSFFNEKVSKEIKKLNLNDSKNLRLKLRLYELKKKGLGSSLFDIDVIKALVALDPNCDLVNNIKEDIDSLKKEINETEREIKSLYNDLVSKKEHLEDISERKKKYIGDIFKSILSILLGVGIYVGSFFGITTLAKRIARYSKYQKEVTAYSKEYGDETYGLLYKKTVSAGDPKDGVFIRVYEDEWNRRGRRQVLVYDMSEFNFDTLEEYLSIPLENLDYEEETEYVNEVNKDHIARNNYKMVEKAVYNYVGEERDTNTFVIFELLLNIVGIVISLLIELLLSDSNHDLLTRLRDLVDNFESLKYNNYRRKEQLVLVRGKTIQLLELIKKDEKLKAEFEEKIIRNKELFLICKHLDNALETHFEDMEEKKKVLTKIVK